MSQEEGTTRPWPKISRLRTLGPVTVIVAALIAAGIGATVNESNSNSSTSAVSSSGAGGGGAKAKIGTASVPLTFAAAANEGKASSINWGPQCDTKTGKIKMPSAFAPPCVPVFSGSNGGATYNGVTSSTINVVYYQPQPGGLTSAISSATGTNSQALATAEAYVNEFNKVFQLYGRHVNLIPFTASGQDQDPVAAHADAVTVAQQLHAFASINGPALTNAYVQELSALHVLCLACGASSLSGLVQQNAPYQWPALPTADTSVTEAVGYLLSKLNGKDAIWAGDKAFQKEKRSFIFLSSSTNPPSPGTQALTNEVTSQLTKGRANFVKTQRITYNLDVSTLPSEAATVAEKLKASGATTVIFAGDPIMPIYLTGDAAKIGYFPEWVITGTVLTDTTTLARFYNQKEWAHAFGVTSLAVPVPLASSLAYHLYSWWYGANAKPASLAAPAIEPGIQGLFTGLQLTGPNLTPSTYTAGAFKAPPEGGGPTTPLIAYGNKGAPPLPSYASPADYTFLWYNATKMGPDEEGKQGTGVMEYVNGGKRYKAGTVPPGPVPMFSEEGAVTTYTNPPDSAPNYPAWPGSPASGGH